MILNKQLPDGTKRLSEGDFAKAYITVSEESGSSWSTLDVVRSWEAYKHNPAGHFITETLREKAAKEIQEA